MHRYQFSTYLVSKCINSWVVGQKSCAQANSSASGLTRTKAKVAGALSLSGFLETTSLLLQVGYRMEFPVSLLTLSLWRWPVFLGSWPCSSILKASNSDGVFRAVDHSFFVYSISSTSILDDLPLTPHVKSGYITCPQVPGTGCDIFRCVQRCGA